MISESSQQKPNTAIGRRSHQGRGRKNMPKIISLPSGHCIKLHESENPWRPGHKQELVNNEEMTEEELFRKIRGILNKLTPQKFQTVVEQVKELPINNMKKLEGAVNLIYERAVDEPNCSVLYAKMCKQLSLMKAPLEGGQGVVNFMKLILTKCQKEFEDSEKIWEEKMKEIKNAKDEEKSTELQLEIDEEEKKMRWRRLGNIIFIGELFKLNMLIESIIHECIKKLLDQGDEESLECVCLLLKTTGKELNEKGKQSRDMMDSYFDSMQKVVDKRLTSARVRFMLQDVIDLKKINNNMKQENGREETDVTGNTITTSFDSDDSFSLHSDVNAKVEKEKNTNGLSMVFLDSTSTFAGELSVKRISTKEQEITWNISRFLIMFWREKEIVSPKFSFADVTCHFCFSMDSEKNHCLFAINVLTHSSSDPECDFSCRFSFLDVLFRVVKNIKCDFKCESALWSVTNFLPSSEIDNLEGSGAKIVCRISVKNSSIKEACSQTEISYFTHSAVEAHTQTQLPEKADEELPMPGFDYKVLQDFKNLFLNGEGSDVTLQVEDQQFKAHRLFLMARSSVFAAMFNCDMTEKATGIVNVKDCELSSFPVFLEYLYCGGTEKLSSENVFNLYVSADKYDIQDLKRKCLEFMKNNLSVNTFCETIQIALQHSERDLLKLATEFFIRNLQDIILTTKWQTFIVENPIQGNELFIKAAKTFR